MSDSTRQRTLKVGIMFPPFRPWRELRPLVETIEAVGLDSIWMMDHLTLRYPTQTIPVAECWSIVSALAAATHRVELGTLVSCTGYRNPAVLAKIAVTVDEISSGRLIVGLGAGWHEPEYLAFGLPFDHRAGRFDEAFAIIRGLLREGRADVAWNKSAAEGIAHVQLWPDPLSQASLETIGRALEQL